jgi:hypothetical protein
MNLTAASINAHAWSCKFNLKLDYSIFYDNEVLFIIYPMRDKFKELQVGILTI